MTRDLFTMVEAAGRFHHRAPWLRDWLRDHPPAKDEPPFYLQAGRERLFSERHIERIAEKLRSSARAERRFLHASGYIYFARIGEFIKIGWTLDVRDRINALQTASPFEIKLLGVAVGTMKDEKSLHKRHASNLVRGEWFRRNIRLMRDVRAMTNYEVTRQCR